MKMTTKRTRRKKTRSGSQLIVFLTLLLALSPSAGAAKKEKKRAETAEAFAVIAGTVYRPPGFAIAGADVTLTPETEVSSGVKLKKTKVVTDSRGEFAIRVQPVPARYRVGVQMNGFEAQQKLVAVEGEQRHDVSFLLTPSSKDPGGSK